jgi:catechol 2,3-dioxygenase-like lactoylglutathione lyase family enzyme
VSACFCCGHDYPDDELDRLRDRSEVAVCGRCLTWLLASRNPDMVRAVPVLPTADLAASTAFWTAAGFGVEAYSADFAAATRNGVELHLVGVDGSDRDRGGAYLHVADVDAVRAAWDAAGLPVSAVRDEPWGMREFHLVDPGGNRVRIGRSISD